MLAQLDNNPAKPRDIHIPRWASTIRKTYCEIHVFCYASERAYVAANYIRSKGGTEISVRLICSFKGWLPLIKTPPHPVAYSGVIWSTFAELLL